MEGVGEVCLGEVCFGKGRVGRNVSGRGGMWGKGEFEGWRVGERGENGEGL